MVTFQDNRRMSPSQDTYYDAFNGYTDASDSYSQRFSPRMAMLGQDGIPFRVCSQDKPFCCVESPFRRVKRESKALVLISPETNAPIDHYRCSDQSSTSGTRSTVSEDNSCMSKLMTKFRKPELIPELPLHSKLHRWMDLGHNSNSCSPPSPSPPKKTSGLLEKEDSHSSRHMLGRDDPPLGLYFHGISNIWSHNVVVPSNPLPQERSLLNPDFDFSSPLDDVSLSCTLNNEVAESNNNGLPRATSQENNLFDPMTFGQQSNEGIPRTSRLWTWIGDNSSFSS